MRIALPLHRERVIGVVRCALLFYAASLIGAAADAPRIVTLVTGTHGTVTGWLTNFSAERSYMLNNYLSHLDRAEADDRYTVAISEVPNLMGLLELAPERRPQLERLLRLGRVELVNAFFLESSMSLSSGETLVRSGIEGLRWYEAEFHERPRFGWFIDEVGVHRQIPEIVHHLGLSAMLYGRNGRADLPLHWWKSPSGHRVMAVFTQGYAHARSLFRDSGAVSASEQTAVMEELDAYIGATPPAVPLLWLLGGSDYSPAPRDPSRLAAFLEITRGQRADLELRFESPSQFLDRALTVTDTLPELLPVVSGDSLYSYNAFVVANPWMKQTYRQTEMRLLAAEATATLDAWAGSSYPGRDLYRSWLALFLNTDRGLIWGIGDGSVFDDPVAWNTHDRFQFIAQILDQCADRHRANQLVPPDGPRGMRVEGTFVSRTSEPQVLPVPGSGRPAVAAEMLLDNSGMLCLVDTPAFSVVTLPLEPGEVARPRRIPMPVRIHIPGYDVGIDSRTGDLTHLSISGSTENLLGGPANRIAFERQLEQPQPQDFLRDRGGREWLPEASSETTEVECWEGPIAHTVVVHTRRSDGISLVRQIRLYRACARIDCETQIAGVPPGVLVSADFPLSASIVRERRGIPYGFVDRATGAIPPTPERFLMTDHRRFGTNSRTVPAIGWSDHETASGSALAIFDRGIPGRESNDATATLLLANTSDDYRGKKNRHLSAAAPVRFAYALLPHDDTMRSGELATRALAYNLPVSAHEGVGDIASRPVISCSSNFLPQSLRLVRDGIELRGVECDGRAGRAWIRLDTPAQRVDRTDACGRGAIPVPPCLPDGSPGARYEFDLEPQEICTLRLAVGVSVADEAVLTDWSPLVPESKRSDLAIRNRDLVGHPPE